MKPNSYKKEITDFCKIIGKSLEILMNRRTFGVE